MKTVKAIAGVDGIGQADPAPKWAAPTWGRDVTFGFGILLGLGLSALCFFVAAKAVRR